MPIWLTLVLIALVCIAASFYATLLALHWLTGFEILDRPNARSSHIRPVVRGGGIGFMAVILIALAATSPYSGLPLFALGGGALIAAISFADDVRQVPFWLRLAVQAIAVVIALASIPSGVSIISGDLPVAVDRALAALAWLWFINLFNFMDGIDGIAGGEAAVIGIGIVVLAIAHPVLESTALAALVIAAASVGFLFLNWHPARLFMGDVGSAGLGFLLGWLLIEIAAAGYLAAALILPMIFLGDATSTLVVRAIRRRPLATAHRDHAYQAAVDRGVPQPVVSGLVIAAGIPLTGLALLSTEAPAATILAALAITAMAIAWMRWGGRRQSDPNAR